MATGDALGTTLEFETPGSFEPIDDMVGGGSFKKHEPPEIKGTGYVVRSLEAALWAFHKSDDFQAGALKAVNLGDDADTTGAIYGQVAGAHYGVEAISVEWRENLVMGDEMVSMADAMFEHSRKHLEA